MSAKEEPRGRSDVALIGGGVLMVLCCAVGPAVIGAVAGSAVGGWLGIACAVILAAAVGLLLHRRMRKQGGGC
jgi:outer membrane lipoprotein SlyB